MTISKPRLLLFTLEFYPFQGGVASYNDNLIRGLAQMGYRVDVLTSRLSGRREEEKQSDRELVRSGRIRVVRKQLYSRGKLLQWAFIIPVFILFFRKPDVILITDDAGQRVASVLQISLLRIPYFITVHGSEVYSTFSRETSAAGMDRKLFRWFKRRAERFFSKSEGVIFVSRYTRDLFKRFFDKPLKRCKVVHNGIGEDIILSEPEVKKRYEARGDKIVCITVSRIDPRKNHAAVFRALKLIPDSIRSRIIYKIIGSGPFRNELEARARRLGLENQIIFLGELSEKQKYRELDTADIYIMPSKQVRGTVEGLGISFLEAAARGLPLIGGRHGGVPEVIHDGYNGFLVDPDDNRGIMHALKKLVENHSLREKMGWNSWKRVREHFTREKMTAATREFMFRN